jgi:hypothetical protein
MGPRRLTEIWSVSHPKLSEDPTKLYRSFGGCPSQLQSPSPMAKPRLAAIVKRRMNKQRFAMTTNQCVSTLWKQRSVKSDDRRLAAAGNRALPAFSSCPRPPWRKLITLEARNPSCRPSYRKPDIYSHEVHRLRSSSSLNLPKVGDFALVLGRGARPRSVELLPREERPRCCCNYFVPSVPVKISRGRPPVPGRTAGRT